jgi:hypothetical protein
VLGYVEHADYVISPEMLALVGKQLSRLASEKTEALDLLGSLSVEPKAPVMTGSSPLALFALATPLPQPLIPSQPQLTTNPPKSLL